MIDKLYNANVVIPSIIKDKVYERADKLDKKLELNK